MPKLEVKKPIVINEVLMYETESEAVVLCAGQEKLDRSVKAILFGFLTRRALDDGLASYHSDLFHDALFVEKHITEPCTFYWAVRESGTWISLDADGIEAVTRHTESTVYRVTLSVGRSQRWIATFTKLERADS